jgi:hypothetical protein
VVAARRNLSSVRFAPLLVPFRLKLRAGIPARRPGNFLLSCQKKVTKEEALKTHPGKHLHRGFGW